MCCTYGTKLMTICGGCQNTTEIQPVSSSKLSCSLGFSKRRPFVKKTLTWPGSSSYPLFKQRRYMYMYIPPSTTKCPSLRRLSSSLPTWSTTVMTSSSRQSPPPPELRTPAPPPANSAPERLALLLVTPASLVLAMAYKDAPKEVDDTPGNADVATAAAAFSAASFLRRRSLRALSSSRGERRACLGNGPLCSNGIFDSVMHKILVNV